MSRKVLIVRNFASEVNINSYNLQEVGLGKAFVEKGFDCEVVYYSEQKKNDEIIYSVGENYLTIKWERAWKFMSNSIFYSLLKKSVINQYDFVISTEYNQVMTFLLSLLFRNKVYLYHGPYQDNNKKIVQRVYDIFLVPIMQKKITKVFTKSDLAKEYLINKGFKRVQTIGVGLDIEKLEKRNSNFISNLKNNIDERKKNLLYVGVMEDRRNIEFLFKVLAKLKSIDANINLILVGDGLRENIDRYFLLASKLEINKNIFHIKQLPQSELKYLYESVDLFVFPTSYEIFGMVLLESMYYKLPVVSTFNGGSQMLINEDSGIVLKELDEQLWTDKIYEILQNESLRSNLGENAHRQINEKFTWNKIVDKIVE